MNRPGAETALRGVNVIGPVDATTLVFVHGAVFQRRMWAPQRNALAESSVSRRSIFPTTASGLGPTRRFTRRVRSGTFPGVEQQ